MEKDEKTHTSLQDSLWWRDSVKGPDADLWRKAMTIYLYSKQNKKSLDEFFRALKGLRRNRMSNNQISFEDSHERNRTEFLNRSYLSDFHVSQSCICLIKTIVTKWKPRDMEENNESLELLSSDSLDSNPIVSLTKSIEKTREKRKISKSNALSSFCVNLTKLHYHETWTSIMNDYNNIANHGFPLEYWIENVSNLNTNYSSEIGPSVCVESNISITDPFSCGGKILRFFDVVIFQIEDQKYFGVVVSVNNSMKRNAISRRKSKRASQMQGNHSIPTLHTSAKICVSTSCATALKKLVSRSINNINISKVSSIKSSARMIYAIEELKCWSRAMNLINPMPDDAYFQKSNRCESQRNEMSMKLNDEQKKAIQSCSNLYEDETARLNCIFGPPGTGKSRTIAEMIVCLLPQLFQGRKILIAAPSNTACDEVTCRILDRIAEKSLDESLVLRVGGQVPTKDRIWERFNTFLVINSIVNKLKDSPSTETIPLDQIQNEILNKSKIIVSTLNNCASSILSRLINQIDLIIVDEASQSLMADSFILHRFNCEKIILVGDHNQLPPTVLSRVGKKNNLGLSLYEHLYRKLPKERIIELRMQYRMHREICMFPNETFYGRILTTHESANRNMESCKLLPVAYYNIVDSKEVKEANFSLKNECEAKIIDKFCRALIEYLKSIDINPHDEIMVITLYKAQRDYLKSLLPHEVTVMTCDAAQGSESSFVILSCVRTTSNIGFLTDIRRLNVALTRARRGLYIFGSLTEIGTEKVNLTWWKLWADGKVRKICHDVKDDIVSLPLQEN